MAQPSSPLAQAVLRELKKFPRLDPQAVLAIAAHEGLSGGIGDGGHAFGPFQMNDAGGVLTGKMGGTPGQKNAWAWTPAGIDTALSGISHVANGLHGLPAIEAIATRYERPANPQAEIADAAHHYGIPYSGGATIQGGGATGGVTGTGFTGGMVQAPAPPDTHAFLQSLLGSISPTGQLDSAGVLGALQARGGIAQAAVGTPKPRPPRPPSPVPGFRRPVA